MIATSEAVDVLRHGWEDAASLLAPDLPEVAGLLRERLEESISARELDEQHLLDTIDDVEAVSARAGSQSGHALGRRLRRTVYEYLLALDAVRPDEATAAVVSVIEDSPVPYRAPAVFGDPLVAAAAGDADAGVLRGDDPAATVGAGAEPESDDADDTHPGGQVPRWRFALRRRQRDDDSAERAPDAAGADDHIEQSLDEPQPLGGVTAAAATDAAGTLFRAPRAGFHIVEGDDLAAQADDESPLEMPPFEGDDVAAADAPEAHAEPPGDAVQHESATAQQPEPESDAGPEFVPWHTAGRADGHAGGSPTAETAIDELSLGDAPPSAQAVQPAVFSAVPPAEAPRDAAPTADPPPVVDDGDSEGPVGADDDGVHHGWRVRDNRHAGRRRGASRAVAAETEEDPFGSNPRLAELRRRIEERLRRKRCDEAAALLQALARDTGGRAVADLAMNAGDRCRALGKSNAALNCYLAASRSDPVYELPLSRLADVCIDSQDTELAVSYLERIARLYRFRGEDKDALRVYRRIASIAPYREDVLTLLMNAQRSGRLE